MAADDHLFGDETPDSRSWPPPTHGNKNTVGAVCASFTTLCGKLSANTSFSIVLTSCLRRGNLCKIPCSPPVLVALLKRVHSTRCKASGRQQTISIPLPPPDGPAITFPARPFRMYGVSWPMLPRAPCLITQFPPSPLILANTRNTAASLR